MTAAGNQKLYHDLVANRTENGRGLEEEIKKQQQRATHALRIRFIRKNVSNQFGHLFVP